MLLRPEMFPLLARAAVQRLRSGNELDVDDRGAVRIEQRLEDLLRSGLTPASKKPTTRPVPDYPLRASTVVERRTAVLARSPAPQRVRVTEETLGRFLDAVAAALCSSESLSGTARAREGIRAALRAALPSRVEVDPESPVLGPDDVVPSSGSSGGPSPAGAAAKVGAGAPSSPPRSPPDDGFDLD